MVDSYPSLETRRVAMLIDGDNAQPSLVEKMLTEAGKYGPVTIRRIYGDWTTPNMRSWKETLNIHALQPIQQFRYTTGKNATDSAMIIDAMDILYGDVVSGFCLVSSDSDYTRLATRIREKGIFVMGIGTKTTPRAFVAACEMFVYTENLLPEVAAIERTPIGGRGRGREAPVKPVTPEPLPLLKAAFDMAVREDGWASLGAVGERLRQVDPGFDSRTYGHKQLSQLIRAFPDSFETREQRSPAGPSAIDIRLKE